MDAERRSRPIPGDRRQRIGMRAAWLLLSALACGDAEPLPQARPAERDAETIRQLEALGYVEGTQPVPDVSDVTLHDAARAQPGLNFYISGHAPEAHLIDMDGRHLHRWSYGSGRQVRDSAEQRHLYWRKAEPLPNGDVLAIIGFPHNRIRRDDESSLVRIDRDSKLVWEYFGKANHDFDLLEDGRIYVLTHQARRTPSIPEEPVLEDFVVVLDEQGRELRTVSVLECLANSPETGLFQDLRERMDERPGLQRGDILHTNKIEVLDGSLASRVPGFAAGNVLLSIRQLDALVVLDLTAKKVTWWMKGGFRKQHHSMLLPNGNIILFDNVGPKDHSAVLEIDPATKRIVWAYGFGANQHFFSHEVGATHRLRNGNTLIVESYAGRAFEVLPDKTRVWEFVTPHRSRRSPALVPALHDVVRLPAEYGAGWLPRDRKEGAG